MFSDDLLARAALLIALCRNAGIRVATAESCTGGLLAALLTEISGSGDVFDRGLVTYSNAAKIEGLSVPAAMIERYGAVSAETASAMAEGALQNAHADIAVAITGIAGPTGGSPEKPVGLVHFACSSRGAGLVTRAYRFGDIGRSAVRRAAVDAALRLLEEAATAIAASA